MSIDRRQFKRFETLLIVEIGPQKESVSYFFGITKNVSFEGFIFESQNYDLRPGDILEFRLKHPKNNLSVPVLGEIVWNRETKFECYSGIKFHRFDNETKSKVFELISADTIEGSGQVNPGGEVCSAMKRNSSVEPDTTEREGIRSDIVGQAATHKNSTKTGQDNIRNGASLPVNGTNNKDDMGDVSAGEQAPGDAVNIGDSEPDAQKKEGEFTLENISRPTNGSIAAKRNSRKKRLPYAFFTAVSFALLLATALIIFISDDVREKITPQVFSSKFIENTGAVNHDGGVTALNATGVSWPPSVPIDQSESLADYDKQTAGEHALTETGMPSDQNGHENLADNDYNGTAQRLKTLPMTEDIVEAQDKKVLLQEAERGSDQPVASRQDHTSSTKANGIPGHIALKDNGDKKINKAKVEGSAMKKEAVQKIRATVTEQSKPISYSAKGKKAEKPVASEEKKSLQQSPVQERPKTASNKKNDKSKKLSKPENDEAADKKRITLQKPDKVTGNEPSNGQPASIQEKEQGRDLQIAKNVSRSEDEKRSKAVESIKKSKTDMRNDPVMKKVSKPVRKTPAETLIAKKDDPQIETAESAGINKKPRQKAPLTISGSKIQDNENYSKQDRSKKPAGRDGMPKIALVLQKNQSKASDVKNKPEITDEYLKKYFTAYKDTFDDNSNNWDIFDIGAASARIEDGLYHIKNKKQGGALIVLHYQGFPHESDFVLEISIRTIKGLDKNSYGFIFGAKDARDNYSFHIRENKYYAVKNYHHGESDQLTAGEIKDSLINKNSATLLKIVKQDDDIKFYINNGYIDKVSNLEFYGNQIGFIVEGKSHIAIDYTRSYIRRADGEHTK